MISLGCALQIIQLYEQIRQAQGSLRLLGHQRKSSAKYENIIIDIIYHLVRFLLEYVQLPYEEKRYTQGEEWFQEDKVSYPFNQSPLTNLPYLRDGDKVIFESSAIPSYIAHRSHRLDLFGKGIDAQVYATQTESLIKDIQETFLQEIVFASKEKFQIDQGKGAFNSKVLPILRKLDTFLAGRKFCAGSEVTLADFPLYELEDMIRQFSEENFKSLYNVSAHYNNFSSLPAIKKYRISPNFIDRPFFPGNWG